MVTKGQQKKNMLIIICVILSFILVLTFINYLKVDKIRDPISIKSVDLAYVKDDIPEFYIESIKLKVNDKQIGNQINLGTTDYEWVINILEKNKKEISEKKHSDTYYMNITFQELSPSFEYDRSEYDGKQITFYISKKLREQFIEDYIDYHPVNTVIERYEFETNETINGYITIDSQFESQYEKLVLEIYGSRKDGAAGAIEVLTVDNKINDSFGEAIFVPLSFEITPKILKFVDKNVFRIQTKDKNGMVILDEDTVKIKK